MKLIKEKKKTKGKKEREHKRVRNLGGNRREQKYQMWQGTIWVLAFSYTIVSTTFEVVCFVGKIWTQEPVLCANKR